MDSQNSTCLLLFEHSFCWLVVRFDSFRMSDHSVYGLKGLFYFANSAKNNGKNRKWSISLRRWFATLESPMIGSQLKNFLHGSFRNIFFPDILFSYKKPMFQITCQYENFVFKAKMNNIKATFMVKVDFSLILKRYLVILYLRWKIVSEKK